MCGSVLEQKLKVADVKQLDKFQTTVKETTVNISGILVNGVNHAISWFKTESHKCFRVRQQV